VSERVLRKYRDRQSLGRLGGGGAGPVILSLLSWHQRGENILPFQAFHWCPDYDAAAAEFARILKPGGIAVLIWNLEDRFVVLKAVVAERSLTHMLVKLPHGLRKYAI
jgi:SAM-dependent methyltransferase